MDGAEFQSHGREMVAYIVDYLANISSRRVTPIISPGYLAPLLPSSPPLQPDNWDDIMRDVEDKIMPGLTHWQVLW